VTVRGGLQEDEMRSLEEKRLTGHTSGHPYFPIVVKRILVEFTGGD